MRTRSRSNRLITATTDAIAQFSEQYYSMPSHTLVNSYVLPNAGSPPVIMYADLETIVDDPTAGKSAKQVLHTNRIISRKSYPVETYGNATQQFVCTEQGTFGTAHWRAWGPYGDVYPENIQVNWDVSDETLIRQCMDDFYSTNDVDTLLNAIEAPQFTDGLKSMYNNVNAPVYPKSKVPALLRARKLTKFLSGGYLYYAFGVAPVISDMRKLSKATVTYSKRLKKALATAGTAVSVHRKCKGSFAPTLVHGGLGFPQYYGSPSSNGTFWSVDINHLHIPEKIVSIRGIRAHKYESQAFGMLDDLATRFGSTGPASFLWERIPFSFVVDWFVDASGVFNALDNFLTGSRKRIQDATLSTKWSCLAGVIKHKYNGTTYSTMDGTQTALNELSYYHRKPIDPTVSVGASGRFGKKQIALTSALLGQMAANLKLKR
jgi:hypothetical protein